MKIKYFRPMLAGTCEDTSTIKYPVLCTPKIDGIRCVISPNGEALSRSLKPIPNDYIRRCLAGLPPGLDGELISGDTFQSSTSAIMSHDGMPVFKYVVFDNMIFQFDNTYIGYADRCIRLETLRLPVFCTVLMPQPIRNEIELLEYETDCLSQGYEGVMIRSLNGMYKYGRSTVNEGYLLKLKRFCDSEAVITGMEEMMHNCNTATVNELGNTERKGGTSKDEPSGIMGALQVMGIKDFHGIKFNIGSGFTHEQRYDMWNERTHYYGKIVKYKYQPVGVKDKPRSPIFLGLRDKVDYVQQ